MSSAVEQREVNNLEYKIFDTLLEPTFIIDQNKCIHYCNEPAALICDVSARKIQRNKSVIDQIFKFTELITNLDQLDQVSDPTPYQEVSFTTESGKTGKVQITIQAFPYGEEQKKWLVYFRDVTLEETLQKKYRAELEQKEDVILDLQKAKAELQNYSENLEKMVEERTAEIARMNQTMRALLDSLSQGFFIFNKEGSCLPVYSQACTTTIECEPVGRKIWEILKVPENKVEGFQKWMKTVFMEMLPFPDLAAIGPQKYPHSKGQHIQLEYYPLRNQDQTIEGVVVVASDITNLIHAQAEAENEKAHAKMILSLIQNKRAFASFLREAKELLSQVQNEFQKKDFDPENTFRLLHTLKGGAATFSMKPVADQCHLAETYLSHWKEYPTAENSQKLKDCSLFITPLFEKYLSEHSEIIGTFNKSERTTELPLSQLLRFEQNISHDQSLHQKFYEEFLMEPIGHFFQSFEEPVQQVAHAEGKIIRPLQFQNEEIRILPEPYEGLLGTLIHAYRNAADHGIETPEVRRAAGKPVEGNILTSFQLRKDSGNEFLLIQIQDDGGGIDPQKIRARLEQKGLSHQGETDAQVIQHVFDSQLSTKEQVSEISGRGVGMDALLFSAKKLGGKAWVESKLTKGTSLFVQVPYFRTYQNFELKKAS